MPISLRRRYISYLIKEKEDQIEASKSSSANSTTTTITMNDMIDKQALATKMKPDMTVTIPKKKGG